MYASGMSEEEDEEDERWKLEVSWVRGSAGSGHRVPRQGREMREGEM